MTLDAHAEATAASLDEPFRSRALRCFFIVRAYLENDKTIQVILRDGYRDAKSQREKFKVGRRLNPITNLWEKTGLVPVITNATPQLGPHCYRRAAHVILLDTKDTATSSDNTWLGSGDARWNYIGDAARQADVRWGGTWQDFSHIESFDWKQIAKGRGYKPLLEGERIEAE